MPAVTKKKKRKKRRTRRRKRKRRPRSRQEKRAPQIGLPGWKELSNENGRARTGAARFLEGISTVRFALVVMALAGLCALYVGHVHATQQLLSDLQEARLENRRLHLRHSRVKSLFNEVTGPTVIYERAKALGLEEGLAYGPTIHLSPEHEADRKNPDGGGLLATGR